MEFTVWELAAAIVAGAAIGFALRRRNPRQDLTGVPTVPPARHTANPAAEALPPLNPAQSQAIADALARGNKIEAIKLLREATGLGLKELKDAVERMEAGRT